ncbi:MAG: GNAT family N-acetyltransferase [Nitrospirae bacterium]|nr:MAG: GNAT family N-acetyltransferase [Nitrospirota bacterium]
MLAPDSGRRRMSDGNQAEHLIARVTVLADPRFLPALTDLVADIATTVGLDEDGARKLDAVLDEVFRNVVEQGYKGDAGQSLDVIVSRRAHALVVAVEDKGLPFDYRQLQAGRDSRFSAVLSAGYVDQVNFLNRGPNGNRVELIRELPAADFRDRADPAEHRATVAAAEAHPEEAIATRPMRPEEAADLARLIYRCYGYTYPGEFIYYPEKVEAKQRAGMMKSYVACNQRGELVGHLALTFPRPGARVAEAGQVVVDPRYRGHGLFQRMKRQARDEAAANQVVGIYSEAVTVHPYSQKGSLDVGAHEVGFLLGYTSGTISFRNISESERPRRQSIAFLYLKAGDHAPVTVHLPAPYRGLAQTLYEAAGIPRRVASDQDTEPAGLPPAGHLTVSLRPDHNQAILTVDALGRDTLDSVRSHLRELRLQRVDCIYADLPLLQEGAGALGAGLRKLGFFFGALIPEFGPGDVLRLQYLNNVDIVPADIHTASEAGRKLLATILDDQAAVTT